MIIPVRCFTCGKPVAHLWEEYKKMIDEDGLSVKEALDKLKLKRFCCRNIFISHVDIIDEIARYRKY